MGHKILAAILSFALAGCMGGSDKNADVPDPTDPTPAIGNFTLELYNATVRWPGTPQDPERWTFEAPENATNLTVDFNLFLDPPAGYGCCYMADPIQAVLIAPDESRTVLWRFNAPHPAYHCVNPGLPPCPLNAPPHVVIEDSQPGTWMLELGGQLTADAWLGVVAVGPNPS